MNFDESLQSAIDAQIQYDKDMEISYADIICKQRENLKNDAQIRFLDSICQDDFSDCIFKHIPSMDEALVTIAFKVDKRENPWSWTFEYPMFFKSHKDGWYSASCSWPLEKERMTACFSEVMSHVYPDGGEYSFSCLVGGRIYDEMRGMRLINAPEAVWDKAWTECYLGRSLTFLECSCAQVSSVEKTQPSKVFFRILMNFGFGYDKFKPLVSYANPQE